MARSPGLLAADLTEKNRLQPLSGSLTVKMTGSGDADMTLPEGAPAVAIHDLISIYTDKGLAGIYRVTNVAQNYKKQIDVTMLHAIDILSDSVWATQTTFEGTRAQYITALLNQQTTLINGVKPWALGTCADTSTVKQEINYDRLSDLLEDMEEDGGDYYFTYDFSTWPWTVSYMAKPQNAACEFRLTRNVRSATTTYNDADLCTRLHLSVNTQKTENNVTSTVTTIRTYNNNAAQNTWGIVVKTADIDTNDKPDDNDFTEADAWASAFLAKRKEPTVQIQIDGDELKGITGDTWDEYSVGRLCQVALPDYGQSFVERVISVTYPDLFKDPGHVTVSLANNLPKFSESLTDARKAADDANKKASSAGRSAASTKDLTTWSQIVSYQGQALDGTGVMTLWQSGIDMDAQGGVRIFSLQEGLQSLYSGIEVTASQIRAEVSEGLSGMHSELVMTASQIKAEVNDSLSGIASFVVQADQIRSEVSDALNNLGTLIVESSQIRAEVQNALSDFAQFSVEASQIKAEVSDALSRVAQIEVTASQIRQEVEDAEGNMAQMLVTASQIRGEVVDAAGNVSTWVQEASQIRGEISDSANNVSTWTQTVSEIRGEIEDAAGDISTWVQEASQIRGEIQDAAGDVSTWVQTASQIKGEIEDAAGDVSTWVQTASQIKGEIEDASNNVSTWVQTASQIKGEIEDAAGDVSTWVQTASQIKGEIEDAAGDVSTWVQTASQIKGEIEDAAGDVSTWVQTASQIKGEISDSANNVSTWVQEASQIKGEIMDETNGLSARINVNAGRIGLVVNSNNTIKGSVIVDAINDQSTATITADKILLSGNTTVAGCFSVADGALYVSQDAIFRGNVSVLNGGTLAAPSLQLFGSGTYVDLTSSNTKDLITELQISQSGNVYTLQKRTVSSPETWIDVANFNRGAAAILTGAWDRNTHTYTVTAPGSNPASTTVGMTGNGQQDSFSVSVFADGVTTDTVNSINGFLVVTTSSNKANNKAEVRLNAKTGTSSILVSSVTLSDVFDKGAAAVTLSEAWNGTKYTVTASNGKTQDTTVGLLPAGNGSSNFSVSAYHDTTSNTITSGSVYLTEDTANKRVEAHWGSASGTVYGQISTAATYSAGKADVTLSETWNGNKYTVTASNGKYQDTTVSVTAAGNGSSNFTVSAYRDGNTANTVASGGVYLIEDTANKRVEARWGSASGTVYGQISTAATYSAGKADVTLSKASSGNCLTVTASNGKVSNSYINLQPAGNGSDNFSVSAYYGTFGTDTTLITRNVYLEEDTDNKAVKAHWNTAAGTVYAQVSTTETYNAGVSSVSLSKTSSGNRLTVTASNGKTSNSYINLQPDGNGSDNFSVSAYYGTFGTDTTLITRNVYLLENASSKRVEARWNSSSGTVYAQVSTAATYAAGANSVTLSKSWSTSGTFTVTPSNGGTPATTTVGLTANGQNDSATVYIYRDGNTSSTVKSDNLYLVTTSSSVKANNKVDLRWHAKTGTSSVLLATASNVGDIYDKGADSVTMTGAWEIIGANNACRKVSTNNSAADNTTYIHMTVSKADPNADPENHFPVWTYYGANTSNALVSREIYLTETTNSVRSGNRVNARWNSATGSIYGRIDTSATYDKGAASVTLSDSWNNGTYTVTASSPNNKTKSTTIGLTANGQGASATVSAYRDGNTSSTVKSENLYLVTTASSTKADNKVDLRFHAASGTGSVLIATADNVGGIYDAGYNNGYSVSTDDIQLGNRRNEGTTEPSGTRISAQNFGIPSSGYGYYSFTITCHGRTKKYYFPYDMR